MPHASGLLIPLCAIAALAAQDAPKPEFTARELFYSAAEPPKAEPVKSAPKTEARRAKRVPADTAATQPKPVAATPSQTPPTLPGGGHIITASSHAPAPATGTPLGLRYIVKKKVGDDMVEVPASTVFHAADRVQLSVQTNDAGYLYIINQGSSGTWKAMFPSPEVAEGNNHVDGWKVYIMPPGYRMVFDEQTGTEKIFIVFSRDAEPDLEKLIYSLQSGKSKQPAKPASTPADPTPARQKTIVAGVTIDDATVGRLRSTYSRDLIIEKVDASTPGEKKETAVYVVNPTGSSDSRVVADLNLVHQ
jgi:hypothetical protein